VILADGKKGSPEESTPEGGWQVRPFLPFLLLPLLSQFSRPSLPFLLQVIHVGAAAPTLPQPLIDQLARPGRLFVAVGTSHQAIWQVDKDAGGKVTMQELFGVRYVPLTDAEEQHREGDSPWEGASFSVFCCFWRCIEWLGSFTATTGLRDSALHLKRK
jgi:hypothetical protein